MLTQIIINEFCCQTSSLLPGGIQKNLFFDETKGPEFHLYEDSRGGRLIVSDERLRCFFCQRDETGAFRMHSAGEAYAIFTESGFIDITKSLNTMINNFKNLV